MYVLRPEHTGALCTFGTYIYFKSLYAAGQLMFPRKINVSTCEYCVTMETIIIIFNVMSDSFGNVFSCTNKLLAFVT